jgi:hypothetical protein
MLNRISKTNSALIQDELLVEIVLALRGEKPAGPEAFHAINNFIECCIIHEEIWINPVESLVGGGGGIPETILNDPFLSLLRKEGVLGGCPNYNLVDKHFVNIGVSYDSITFITDLRWSMAAMLSTTSEDEQMFFQEKTSLLKNCPSIFEQRRLVEVGDSRAFHGQDAEWAIRNGYSVDDLLKIEAWNRSIDALTNFSNLLGLCLYVIPSATPHQVGAIKNRNRIARAAYERIATEFDKSQEVEIGDSSFLFGRFPALSALILKESRGDREALAESILENRRRFRQFREYLSEFEIKWGKAESRGDRIALQAELDNAINTVTKYARTPKDRIWYKVWDLVKKPSAILQSLGDILVKHGRDEAVIGQVRGLRAFWKESLKAPHDEHSQELFRQLMPRIAPSSIFASSKEMGETIDVLFQ